MPFIPLTDDEERTILTTLGCQTSDDLFASIPPKIRETAKMSLRLPEGRALAKGMTEHEARLWFAERAERNTPAKFRHFLGGGVYDNVIPSAVDALVARGEFLTCYTPYQPEISQGTLKAIFEFQTFICRLTGMEVANASMYDGASAIAEAILMANRLRPGKRSVLISSLLPPDYRQVVDTFLKHQACLSVELGFDELGAVDVREMAELAKTNDPCCAVVCYTNYFGVVEDLASIRSSLPSDCLLVVCIPDPSALSIFETPAALGADIVAGEAHQFGTPMSFGGPHVGFFATRRSYARQMPGRLVGETVDSRGNTAYALTLATREQHIRREKATSNICTNQGLIALRCTIYLSLLGKDGFRKLGIQNYSLFDYLKTSLESLGIPMKFKKAFCYREGLFEVPNLDKRFDAAVAKGIIPGIRPAKKGFQPNEFGSTLLVTVHPKLAKADVDELVEVLSHD
ncbi:MAG: aminomethyl-transferring glycine dehydrogenase subunit GcvPA [Deltaproteobacteria bacterium]|nr:aminomethyl-transferring glycine dehydrogenase subunit GcvPA [Deltaproteobacteria bacterium]